MNIDNTVYYEVETRNKDTGYWQHAITCYPPYQTAIERRRFLLFFTRDVLVVKNLRSAEDTARSNALLHARSYRKRSFPLRYQSRVVHVRISGSVAWHTVIWCNGHFRNDS